MDFERFLDLLRAPASEGVDYVLVGGVALNLHGIVRATEDVDLFIRPSSDKQRQRRPPEAGPGLALERPGDRRDQRGEPHRRLPDYPLRPPDEALVVDLLARLGSAFTFDDLETQTVMVEGVPVRVRRPRRSIA